jgi:hypothetical protein
MMERGCLGVTIKFFILQNTNNINNIEIIDKKGDWHEV